MELQEVSFDLAVKLKEVGFDEDVKNYFVTYTKTASDKEIPKKKMSTEDIGIKPFNANKDENLFSTPTQELVRKWFRKKFKIRLFPVYAESNGTYKFEIRIPIDGEWKMERLGFLGTYNTEEEAIEEGLFKCCELLEEPEDLFSKYKGTSFFPEKTN